MAEEPVDFACESGTPFKWPKGSRLEAVADVTVILPGALLADGQAVQDVLDAPDAAPIGFDRAANGKGFDSIRVRLVAGQSVAMKRSSMAIATLDMPGAIRFRVVNT